MPKKPWNIGTTFEEGNHSQLCVWTKKQINKLVNFRGTRDMSGWLFYLAVRKKSRLNTAFHYLILLEPRCFAHPDGSLQEIKKTSVVHLIKGSINSSIPDGMFLIQTSANDKTPIFTVFTRSVLLKVSKFPKHRVDLCLDLYESRSIKDIKSKSKEDENTEEHFTFGHPKCL